MKIHHLESGVILEVREEGDRFLFCDSRTNRAHAYKGSHEAIWMAIEVIRNVSYDLVSKDDLTAIAAQNQVGVGKITSSTVQSLRNEAPLTTYYDHIFLKLLSSFRTGAAEFALSNKTNFVIEQEAIALLRARAGTRLIVPLP